MNETNEVGDALQFCEWDDKAAYGSRAIEIQYHRAIRLMDNFPRGGEARRALAILCDEMLDDMQELVKRESMIKALSEQTEGRTPSPDLHSEAMRQKEDIRQWYEKDTKSLYTETTEVDMTLAALDAIVAQAEAEGIPCNYTNNGTVVVSMSSNDAIALCQRAAASLEMGNNSENN